MSHQTTDPNVRSLNHAMQECQRLLNRAIHDKNTGAIATYGVQLDHLQQKLDNYLAGKYPTLQPRKD